MRSSPLDPGALTLSLALAAGAAVAGSAAAAYRDPRNAADQRLHRALASRQRPRLSRAARAAGVLGKWYGHGPVSLLLAGAVAHRTGCWRDGAPIVAASAVAALASVALERWLPPRRPPPGRHKPDEPSYPSGHALETAAVATAACIVLDRHGMGRAAAVVPIAVAAPLVSGVAKLYRDRHWATDVVGGWGIGTILGAAIAGAGVRPGA